jgi:hypothetical protein
MARFDDYATKYQTIRMERRDGIVQMTFHHRRRSAAMGSLAAWRVPAGLPRGGQRSRHEGRHPHRDGRHVFRPARRRRHRHAQHAGGMGPRLLGGPLKKQLIEYLGYGLALEGMSVVDRTVTPGA